MSFAAWSPDSNGVVFSNVDIYGQDDRTWRYNIDTLQQIWQVNNAASLFVFSPNGEVIVSGDSQLRFWDATTGRVIDTPYTGNAQLYPAFLPDGSALVVGRAWIYTNEYSWSEIGIWNYELQQLDIIIPHEGYITSIAISPNGEQVAVSMSNLPYVEGGHWVFVWEINHGRLSCSAPGNYVTFSPKGNLFATYDSEGSVTLFNSNNCQPSRVIDTGDYINNFAFSPDGSMLASAGHPYGVIQIRDIATGELLYQQEGLPDLISLLAFSPDGNFLLSISGRVDPHSDVLQIWEVIRSP
jgi:WD40 repeat protein